MKTNRSELVEGKKYYMDNKKDITGVFKGRGENSIYFDCGVQSKYETSIIREGLVMFEDDDEYTGFLEVKLGDDLTEESLQMM